MQQQACHDRTEICQIPRAGNFNLDDAPRSARPINLDNDNIVAPMKESAHVIPHCDRTHSQNITRIRGELCF